MIQSAVPMLEAQKIFHSSDVDRAHSFLRSKDFRLDIKPQDSPQFDLRINGVYFPGMFIGCMQYGAPVTVATTPARDDYWIQLAVRGRIETTTHRSSVVCDAQRAAMCAPLQENRLRSQAGSARLNVSLTQAAVVRQLCALLGDLPRQRITFEPTIELGCGFGRSLTRLLHLAVSEFEHEDSALWQPKALARLEELLVDELLLSHPHNYSQALQRLERATAPRDVKRAIDFIHAHLAEGLTLAEIATFAGVPGRTLLSHFRNFVGISPLRYLSNARFEQVRNALSQGRPGKSVSQIAMSHGFTHMGRFAVRYRQRYGEAPSDTLRHSLGQ